MKATEARAKSVTAAAKNKVQNEAKERSEKLTEEENRRNDNKKFILDFEEDIRKTIKYAVDSGKRKAEHTLSSSNKDLMVAWFRKDDYAEDQYFKENNDEQNYLGKARFGHQIKAVIHRLKNDGYKVEVSYECIGHDDSAAYMNSGGECGSEKPYFTQDNILRITW